MDRSEFYAYIVEARDGRHLTSIVCRGPTIGAPGVIGIS